MQYERLCGGWLAVCFFVMNKKSCRRDAEVTENFLCILWVGLQADAFEVISGKDASLKADPQKSHAHFSVFSGS